MVGESEGTGRPWSHLAGAGFLLFCLWGWAIWSCAEHWESNPNYSYGWVVPALAVGFFYRRYRRLGGHTHSGASIPWSLVIVGVLGGSVAAFSLEYGREQMWHPVVVIWSIALLAVGVTLLILWFEGGRQLAATEIFPVCFFLTAVPWPPRFEQPITSTLMRWVASATTESLHWLGIQAQASGGAIALRTGLVGITEACSGIRSLQAGIMFGLAMGEWFLLSASRRVALLVIAIGLALVTNFGRTLALALQAEWHGIESIDRVHDSIGNITITALVLTIWIAGQFLATGKRHAVGNEALAVEQDVASAVPASSPDYSLGKSAAGGTLPVFVAITVALLFGLGCARGLSAHLDAKSHSQKSPFFAAKVEPGGPNALGKIPREVWNELHPTSGEYIRRDDSSLPRGAADCFHFFWKPSPWNRFALVHRPDICMPGIGWRLMTPPEPIEIEIDGRQLGCYLFKFQREKARAVQLWGAWRNGKLVPVDYKPDQVLGVSAPPASLYLEGKRGSATEMVSCSVISDDREVSNDIAVDILRATFKYNPQ